jgi:hypothetical protein
MRRALAAIALVLAASPAAWADTLDVLKKNTLTLTDAGGGVTTLLLSDEGRMEQTDPAGTWAAGFWSMEARDLCWTARGKPGLCIPLAADKEVGDAWEISGPTGRVVWSARIVEGRADLKAERPAAE